MTGARRAMPLLVSALIATISALTLPPATVTRAQQPARQASIRQRQRPMVMLAPSGDGSNATAASPSEEAARTSLPSMKAIADTTEEQLQDMLDKPLIDPWSTTPDECSIDTPAGCVPGATAATWLDSFLSFCRSHVWSFILRQGLSVSSS